VILVSSQHVILVVRAFTLAKKPSEIGLAICCMQACWKSFLLWVCLTDCSAVVAKSRAVNHLYNLLNSACFSIHTVFPVCLQLSVHCAAASIVTVSIYWTFLVGKDIGSVRRNVGRWSRTQGCEEVSCYSMTFLQLFLTIPKI
jgi:hypothetical protein